MSQYVVNFYHALSFCSMFHIFFPQTVSGNEENICWSSSPSNAHIIHTMAQENLHSAAYICHYVQLKTSKFLLLQLHQLSSFKKTMILYPKYEQLGKHACIWPLQVEKFAHSLITYTVQEHLKSTTFLILKSLYSTFSFLIKKKKLLVIAVCRSGITKQ